MTDSDADIARSLIRRLWEGEHMGGYDTERSELADFISPGYFGTKEAHRALSEGEVRVLLEALGAARTKSGKVLTRQDIEALADEAEQGYDVEHLVAAVTDPPRRRTTCYHNWHCRDPECDCWCHDQT